MALEEQMITNKLLQNALESLGAHMELLWHLLEQSANECIRPTADFEDEQ